MPRDGSESEVMAAAANLVRDFGSHDTSAYFACFSCDATFVFHNHPHRLNSREQYERLWELWEQRDQFRVLSCQSTDQLVTVRGSAAVFIHTVSSRISTVHGETSSLERETIVFEKSGDRWLAIHEHLSRFPCGE